jgi:hypothetical protein
MSIVRATAATMMVMVTAGCASTRGPGVEIPAALPELRLALSDGVAIFVPEGVGNAGASVLVHFHGAPVVVEREFRAARVRAVLVTVNYRGLSAAYETPLAEPQRFESILGDALAELKRRGRLAEDAGWRSIFLSSFSAGYGAVRAILRQPQHFDRVDGIYLADSLYAGYVEEGGQRRVNPENMTPFRRFAAEAAAGRKFLLITHSYLEPGRYAGTHETADDLIGHVGAQRQPVDEWVPDQTTAGALHWVSRADRGAFHVRGCAGTSGEDHMAHLRRLAWGLGVMPLPRGSPKLR